MVTPTEPRVPARVSVARPDPAAASGATGRSGRSGAADAGGADSDVQSVSTAAVAAATTAPRPLLGRLGFYSLTTSELTDRTQLSVNPANGNLLVEAPDVRLPGDAGLDLVLGRAYNSREDVTRPGMTGIGWTMTGGQDIRLSVNSTDSSALFEGPSGYRITFVYDATTATYRKPAGLNATLVRNGTTGSDYTVTFNETGLRYRFAGRSSLTAIEDQNLNRISFAYNTAGQTTSITDTKGGVTTLTYASNGRVASVTDPDGRRVSYAYTGDDLTSVTYPDTRVMSFGYDAGHNLTRITDPRGGITSVAYDTSDRVVSVTWADSTSTRPAVTRFDYTYAPLVGVVDQRGNTTSYEFDTSGRAKRVTAPRNQVRTYAYDANSNVLDYTTPQGGIGALTYDGHNVKTAKLPTGATSTFDYADPDTRERPSRYTDARGVATSYNWDTRRQLLSVTDANGKATKLTYQGSTGACPGALATSTDPNLNLTSFTYDTRCRLSKVDRPAPAGDTLTSYDAFDRPSTITDGKGQKQQLSYDSLDRLTKISYLAAGSTTVSSSVSYTYDANGNRTARADLHGGTTKNSSWTYDARNRVNVETLPNVTNDYDYDVAGNLTRHNGAGGATSYTYDSDNDVRSLTPPVGGAINFSYYEGTYAKIDFPNKVSDAQHYDTSGRTSKIEHYFYDSVANVYRGYANLNYSFTKPATSTTAARDSESLYKITDPDYGITHTYDYDTAGRVKSSRGVSLGDTYDDFTYTYDANSNRTGGTHYGTAYTAAFNAANQLTSQTANSYTGAATYTYDANGNQTGSSGGLAMAYDVRNRTSSVTQPGYAAKAMAYDGSSQFERTAAGGRRFTNSVLGVTSQTDSAGTTYFLRAPDGRVLGQRGPDGKTYYYLTDRLGSIVSLTDPAGFTVTDFGYGPYGEYTYGSDIGPGVPWKFTGEYRDNDQVSGAGFYKVGLRYYNQNHGRWTQTDPLERVVTPGQPPEANVYGYVACDPVNYTDPSGAFLTRCDFLGTAAAVGAGAALLAAGPATLGASLVGLGATATLGLGVAAACNAHRR